MRYSVEILVTGESNNIKGELESWVKIKNCYPIIINDLEFKLGEIKEGEE
uniref:Uncharacterized protein n=1 Tax=viral metagenome TaxID=1070528 RepID=A0A6H2A0E6_9ZZZZ